MTVLEQALEGTKSVAILGHVRPDGDCLGSTLGLYNYLLASYPDIQAARGSVNDPMEMLQDIRKCCGSQNRRQIDQITNLMATIQMMKIMNENPPGGDNP